MNGLMFDNEYYKLCDNELDDNESSLYITKNEKGVITSISISCYFEEIEYRNKANVYPSIYLDNINIESFEVDDLKDFKYIQEDMDQRSKKEDVFYLHENYQFDHYTINISSFNSKKAVISINGTVRKKNKVVKDIEVNCTLPVIIREDDKVLLRFKSKGTIEKKTIILPKLEYIFFKKKLEVYKGNKISMLLTYKEINDIKYNKDKHNEVTIICKTREIKIYNVSEDDYNKMLDIVGEENYKKMLAKAGK